MSLTPEEVHRYARHIMLKEVGGPGQNKLKAAKVALVGVGGLGAPAALYLAAAGVGQLTLIDDDAVALSNLQRQVLFTTKGVASLKVAEAATALQSLNPHVTIHQHIARLTPNNAETLLAGSDVVLDGSDSFETRFAVNAACHHLGVPLVSGAVGRWDGQLAVFASGLTRDQPPHQRKPCYQCFVPQAPPDAETCAAVGIIGALPGVIGAAMALEAVKLITGAGEPLLGRLFLFDALHLEARTVRLAPDPACAICGPPHG
ncbi:MAG: HesA/MoeB/ThiF family protein [Caulobacterales bacterium]|jgi:molybdopterin/thiamine biosynthesis adenylyltransferase